MKKIPHAEFYDEYWKLKNSVDSELTVAIKSTISLIPNDAKSFLDNACGQGVLLLELKKMGFTKVAGTDISAEPVKVCKKRGLDVVQASLDERLPFPDNSFDCVICCNSFMHIFYSKDALNEMKRVSKKYVIVYVPNPLYWTSRLKILFGGLPIFLDDEYSHTRVFTIKKFLKLANACGLKVIEKKYDGKLFRLSPQLFSTGYGFLMKK